MTSDRSVPLSEALQHFSDPSDWHELRSLEPYRITMFVLGEPETEYQRLHWRYRWLKERLETELLDKLITGALVATGEVCPPALDPEPQIIPGRRWQDLKPDFEASEATGQGLRIVKIRVEIARSSHARAAGESEPRDQASLAKLRADLRRWLEAKASRRQSTWCKRNYLNAAREEVDAEVTDNLFKEVWRSAKLPRDLRKPGLRKKGVRPSGSSPPD